MGFFDQFSKPQISDPVFGPLKLSRFGWNGKAPSPNGQGTCLVSVERGRDGPIEADRAVFKALRNNHLTLVPQLKVALFKLWEPSLAEPMWEESWPTTAEALWSMLELDSATVKANGKAELLFAFTGDVWPDAMFVVEVDGTQAVPLSLDD